VSMKERKRKIDTHISKTLAYWYEITSTADRKAAVLMRSRDC